MARVLFVAQDVGGVGKSTITRGIAEAVEDLPVIEIENTHRLTELGLTQAADTGGVRHFPMRASRAEIEASGGQAARAELDAVINALYEVRVPTLVDIGANTAASVAALLPDHAADLKRAGVELGLLVVVAADEAALAKASELLMAAPGWAARRFVVVNGLRGPVDAGVLTRVVQDAGVAHLRRFEFEDDTREILASAALRGIASLDRDALAKAKSRAVAVRIRKDLTAFRAAVMEAVAPAALWLVAGQDESSLTGSATPARGGTGKPGGWRDRDA